MTSYPFIKMAAPIAKFYFQFRICWCRCLQKVKVNQQTKFRRHTSIDGWDMTTSVFEKRTSAILELFFRFRSRPFRRNQRYSASGCKISSKSEYPLRKYDVISIFKMADVSNVVFALVDHPRSAFHGLNSVLKSLVRRINSSEDIAMYRFWRFGLKLPIHAPFWGFLGHIFPIWRHPSSWPPKGTSLGGNTSFEPFSVRICASVRTGRRIEKKGQDNK